MVIDLQELATAIGKLVLRFVMRKRTAANWTSGNEILLNGEFGLEIDGERRKKVGDGVTAWNSLPYDDEYVQSVVAGAGVSVDDTDPRNPIVSSSGVISVVAGTGVTVDNTDPQNPIVNATGGGGGGGMTQLAQVTTTAGQTSFTLMSSIPNTHRQLKIVFQGASVSSNGSSSDVVAFQFNGDTGAHYRYVLLGAYPSTSFVDASNSASSLHGSLISSNGANAAEFSYVEVELTNYAQSSRPVRTLTKSATWQGNVGEIAMTGSGSWNPSTLAAITSIAVLSTGSAFTTGTIVTLYGVD